MSSRTKRVIAFVSCVALVFVFNIIAVCETSGVESTPEVSTGYYRGDCDQNGEIDMKDVLLMRRHMAFNDPLAKYVGDVDADDDVDMRDVLLIRQYLAGFPIILIPVPIDDDTTTTQQTITTTSQVSTTTTTKTPISHEDPAINFIQGSHASLGVWWWAYGMAENDENVCLNLCQKNQVTEIYFYCASRISTAAGREKTHNFVTKAMDRGMRVSVLFDNQSVVKADNTSFTKVIGYVDKYKEEYPSDALYGIHADIEPQASDKATDNGLHQWCQGYITNFLVAQAQEARQKGILVEVDLGIGWNARGRDLSYTGPLKDCYVQVTGITTNADGSYTIDYYDAVANLVDTMCMMSYRDQADNVFIVGREARKVADKAQTKIVYGVECGNANEGDSVDFYAESKEYMYTELQKLLTLLERNEPVGGFGFAIHHITAWYNLRDVEEAA